MSESVSTWDGYKLMTVYAVIVFDDAGNYLIHGSSGESAVGMANAIRPIWNFDPTKEMIQYIEIPVKLPLVSEMKKPQVDGPFPL